MSAQKVLATHRCIGPDLINADSPRGRELGESRWVGACTCGWRGTNPARTRVDWEREHAGHQVDALAEAGYAVVKLPERDMSGEHSTPDFSHELSAWMLFDENPGQLVNSCAGCGTVEVVREQREHTPNSARALGAALLAAALVAAAAHAEAGEDRG